MIDEVELLAVDTSKAQGLVTYFSLDLMFSETVKVRGIEFAGVSLIYDSENVSEAFTYTYILVNVHDYGE